MYFLYQICSGFTNTYISHFAVESAWSQVDTNTEGVKNDQNLNDTWSDLKTQSENLKDKFTKKSEKIDTKYKIINPHWENSNQKTPESIAAADGIEWIDDVKEAQEYIKALSAWEKIVWTHIAVVGSFLEKVAQGKIEGLSKDDPEFSALKTSFNKKVQEYKQLGNEAKTFDDYIAKESWNENSANVDTGKETLEWISKKSIEVKEFTQHDIDAINIQKNQKRQILEKIFKSSLWDAYKSEEIMDYKTELESGLLQSEFNEFLEATNEVESKDLQALGQVYSYDIIQLNNITRRVSIKLRDSTDIDGREFWEVRDEYLQNVYKKLQKEGSQEVREIISSDLELNEELIWKDFSKLTAAEIGELDKAGINFTETFLIWESGKSISQEDFKKGGSFILNVGDNTDILDYGLSHFIQWAKTIKVEWQKAEYMKDGEYWEWYYTAEWKVDIQDGMKISIIDMVDPDLLQTQSESNISKRDDIIKTSIGREMYKKAIKNPEDPIVLKGPLWEMIAKFLNMILGRNGAKSPDGTYGTYDETGNFTPVTWSEYMEKYRGSIRSHPMEYTASGVTACWRTAWKNLKDLWAKNPQRNDAHVLAARYKASGLSANINFPEGMDNVDGPLQLFMDASKKNAVKWYRHTATAFKDSQGNWQVLDPYYWMNGRWTASRNPIPAGTYINYMKWTLWKQFHGAYEV